MTPIDEAALKAERAEFEKWLLKDHCDDTIGPDAIPWSDTRGCYDDFPVHMAYCGWRAARALLHRSQPVAVVPAEQAEDSAMLDWLDQNIFNHEMDDWDRRLHPDSLMWVVYGPTGVQGSARAILRAAIRAAMSNREAGGS